jgi:putative transposase
LVTLAALISGIVGSKSTQLPHIAAKVPNGTKPESRVKGSAHWHGTKAKLGRLHARVAAIRNDALHKLTTRLTTTYQQIVIEDLHVKGMVQNHKLARAISDRGLGRFRQMLM